MPEYIESEEYLEFFDNELGQVFAEFDTFLYLSYNDFTKTRILHNILRVSERIYLRSLAKFFSDTDSQSDDLKYKDFLLNFVDLKVEMPDKVRVFINKSSAHLTKKRGKIGYPDKEFKEFRNELIDRIERFMNEVDSGNLKSKYVNQLNHPTVISLKNGVCSRISERKTLIINKGQVSNDETENIPT